MNYFHISTDHSILPRDGFVDYGAVITSEIIQKLMDTSETNVTLIYVANIIQTNDKCQLFAEIQKPYSTTRDQLNCYVLLHADIKYIIDISLPLQHENQMFTSAAIYHSYFMAARVCYNAFPL